MLTYPCQNVRACLIRAPGALARRKRPLAPKSWEVTMTKEERGAAYRNMRMAILEYDPYDITTCIFLMHGGEHKLKAEKTGYIRYELVHFIDIFNTDLQL